MGCRLFLSLFVVLQTTSTSTAQQLKISDFVIFGGSSVPGKSGVNLSSSTNVMSGSIGSFSDVKSTGSSFIGGNIHSGGTVNLANSNTVSGKITVGNTAGSTGNVLIVGSGGTLSGNIDVNGSILISGGTVKGKVTHPVNTSYSGPAPLGGRYVEKPSIPIFPSMPAINVFPASGSTSINNTKIITPGIYGKMALSGSKKITFSGVGTYVFSEIINSGSTNTFVFDFKGQSQGLIQIYVHGNINLNKVVTTILNGGSESRVYTETHGNGTTSATKIDAFTIANGSAGISSKWSGMVWAPFASINIGSGTGNSDLNGSLWSNKTVSLGSGVKVIFTPPVDLSIGKTDKIIGSELNSLFLNGSPENNLSKNVFLIDGSNVYIEVIARENKLAELLPLLTTAAYGLTDVIPNVVNSLIITGKYPIANLLKLEDRPDLIVSVRPLYPAVSNSGIAYTLGDVAMRSDFVRNGYGVSGDGVTIGVLSDSYNKIDGNPAQRDIDNGDLPGLMNINPVNVLKDFPFGIPSDEGRAMLQIIHDIAPKAKLAFRTGFISAGDFANGINQLQQAACNVIVDDITFITEPFFQDGVVAKAVDAVTALGVSYFSAAGNYGNKSYQNNFNPVAAPSGLTGFAHNFGGGDIYQNISLKPGSYTIVLQWADEIYSLGGSSTGTVNDFDIYLPDYEGKPLFGFNRNNIGGDPIEILSFRSTENTNTNILINRASGSGNVNLKYIIFRGEATINEYNIGTSTIVGQANALGAMAVGAVLYTNTPAFNGVPSMASFSSIGGTPVNGVIRNKPDFAAPNGVNTTVKLGGTNIDNDDFPNFFGTSASAPHAAAAAALIIEARKKFSAVTLAPEQVRSALAESAIDIAPLGPDVFSGKGFIQPNVAMRKFATPKPLITKLILPSESFVPGQVEFTLTVEGDFLDPNSSIWFRGRALPTVFKSTTQLQAVIPAFGTGNPPIYVNTPPISSSLLDGGKSETLNFFSIVKKKITVTADKKIKKYGEKMPAFTASVMVDGVPLANTNFTLQQLGLTELPQLGLKEIKYSSPANNLSNTGNYAINVFTDALDSLDLNDVALLESFTYSFVNNILIIEKLPLKIIPEDANLTYGNKVGNFSYKFQYDNVNIATEDRTPLLDLLKGSYFGNLADAVALVDARAVVNSRALINADLENLSFLVSARALINARQLINAKAVINGSPAIVETTNIVDLAVKSIFDYELYPDSGTLVSARQLVNAKALINAKALVNRTATLNARQLVNGSTLVNSSTVDNTLSEVVVIVDATDFTAPAGDELTGFKSINLVTGITAGQFAIVPGALISSNFDVSYGLGKLIIAPALLTVKANNQLIFQGSPLPVFSSALTGFQYSDVLAVGSGPQYSLSPVFAGLPGVYSIIPANLSFNPVNTDYSNVYVPGKMYVNPMGNGAKNIKPILDCVEALSNHPSGFAFVAHFRYENANSTLVFVPLGSDNDIVSEGRYSGKPPEEFLPGTGSFDIYFNGAKLTWTVKSYKVNQKTATVSEASSSSSRCDSRYLSSTLLMSSEKPLQTSGGLDNRLMGENIFDVTTATLYPNPVSDRVTISWKLISEKDLAITDLSGRQYYAKGIRKLTENSIELDISGFKTGIYLVRVKGESSYKVLRIIKI